MVAGTWRHGVLAHGNRGMVVGRGRATAFLSLSATQRSWRLLFGTDRPDDIGGPCRGNPLLSRVLMKDLWLLKIAWGLLVVRRRHLRIGQAPTRRLRQGYLGFEYLPLRHRYAMLIDILRLGENFFPLALHCSWLRVPQLATTVSLPSAHYRWTTPLLWRTFLHPDRLGAEIATFTLHNIRGLILYLGCRVGPRCAGRVYASTECTTTDTELPPVMSVHMESFLAPNAKLEQVFLPVRNAPDTDPPRLSTACAVEIISPAIRRRFQLLLLSLLVQVHYLAIVGYGEALKLGRPNFLHLENRRTATTRRSLRQLFFFLLWPLLLYRLLLLWLGHLFFRVAKWASCARGGRESRRYHDLALEQVRFLSFLVEDAHDMLITAGIQLLEGQLWLILLLLVVERRALSELLVAIGWERLLLVQDVISVGNISALIIFVLLPQVLVLMASSVDSSNAIAYRRMRLYFCRLLVQLDIHLLHLLLDVVRLLGYASSMLGADGHHIVQAYLITVILFRQHLFIQRGHLSFQILVRNIVLIIWVFTHRCCISSGVFDTSRIIERFDAPFTTGDLGSQGLPSNGSQADGRAIDHTLVSQLNFSTAWTLVFDDNSPTTSDSSCIWIHH